MSNCSATRLDAAKHDAERFRFDTRSKLESQDNNLWLIVFAVVNIVIIAAAIAARR